MVRSSSPASLAAALQLLVAACEHGTTLEQVAAQQQLIAAALEHTQHVAHDVSAGALELLYTISTKPAHQTELIKALLNKAANVGDGSTDAQQGSSRLEVLWRTCVPRDKTLASSQVCPAVVRPFM